MNRKEKIEIAETTWVNVFLLCKELKDECYEVCVAEKEIEELTLEKVCEELGRTIKIIK